ncbi:MAG: zinc dependent phospholipase C family protein [Planctomycetes bacterium]|nr:zinc dependent phospholipase C family protein [Planctomycetota bacterium]
MASCARKFLLSATILAALALPASAWGTKTHTDIANGVIEDLKAGRTSVPGFGNLDLDPQDVLAILTFPEHFRGGSIAPDMLPSSMSTGCTHNLDPVPQARVVLASTKPGTKERAFALGWLVHVASDAGGHHYTNFHTVTKYDTSDLDSVRVHATVEIFIDDEWCQATDIRFDVPLELLERLYFSTNSEVFQRWANGYLEARLLAEYGSIGNIRAWLKDFWKRKADEAYKAYLREKARPWYEIARWFKMAYYWLQHRLFLSLWRQQETTPVAQPNLARSFIAGNAQLHRTVMERKYEELDHAFDSFFGDLAKLVEVAGFAPDFVVNLLRSSAGAIQGWLDPKLQWLVGVLRQASFIEESRKAEIRAHVAGDGGFRSFRYYYNSAVLARLALQRNGIDFLAGVTDIDASNQVEASRGYREYPAAFKPFPGQPLPPIVVNTVSALKRVATTPHDQIALPGTRTVLEAKFEMDLGLGYFNPDLSGKEVEFFVSGVSIGKGITDKDGVARIEYTPPAAGRIEVTYQMTHPAYKGDEGKLILFVAPPRPSVVFDIDGTLSDFPDWLVPISGDQAPAFPYSLEFTKQLAGAGFNVIYVTARDDALDRMTRGFLSAQGFPEGPVFYNDWGLTTREERDQLSSKNHGQAKIRILKGLMAAGIPIVAGVGNAPTDAEAYKGVGIESYIIRSGETIPAGSTIFGDYRELAGILLVPAKLADLHAQARAGLQALSFQWQDLDAGEVALSIDGTLLRPTYTPGVPGSARATFFRLARSGTVLDFAGNGPAGGFAYVRDVDVTGGLGDKIHDGPASWSLLDTTKGKSNPVTLGQ